MDDREPDSEPGRDEECTGADRVTSFEQNDADRGDQEDRVEPDPESPRVMVGVGHAQPGHSLLSSGHEYVVTDRLVIGARAVDRLAESSPGLNLTFISLRPGARTLRATRIGVGAGQRRFSPDHSRGGPLALLDPGRPSCPEEVGDLGEQEAVGQSLDREFGRRWPDRVRWLAVQDGDDDGTRHGHDETSDGGAAWRPVAPGRRPRGRTAPGAPTRPRP